MALVERVGGVGKSVARSGIEAAVRGVRAEQTGRIVVLNGAQDGVVIVVQGGAQHARGRTERSVATKPCTANTKIS